MVKIQVTIKRGYDEGLVYAISMIELSDESH